MQIVIWVALLAAFAYMWRKGHLARIRKYVGETREELRKCSWPSREELKGSTVVVLFVTALIGVFTVVVDFVISRAIQLIA